MKIAAVIPPPRQEDTGVDLVVRATNVLEVLEQFEVVNSPSLIIWS